MKRTIGVASLLLVCMLSLTACAAKQAKSAADGAPDGGAPSLPMVTQLLAGTFKLEGTDQAVDAEQAAKLLPLWKAYNTLSRDSSAVQKELAALTSQIEKTMTAEQRKAINEMKLSFQDVSAIAQAQGIEMAMRGPSGRTGAGGAQNGMPAGGMPPEAMGGGMPGGGIPDGGGMPGGGPGGFPGGGRSSSSESSSVTHFGVQGTTALIEALIKLLESKVASS